MLGRQGVIERENLAVTNDFDSIYEYVADRPVGRVVNEGAKWVPRWQHVRVFQIDHRQIGLHTRRKLTEILASQGPCATDRCGRKNISSFHGVDVFRRDASE